MQQKKIIFLASDCESSRWVYHALKNDFHLEAAIIEQPISKKKLAIARVKRIGVMKVIGQVLFTLLVVPILTRKAKGRKAALIHQYLFNSAPINKAIHVQSVNDEDCLLLLQKINPDIVIVNGTRIISKKTLNATRAIFINMHVGITPKYRGSHGGYWALYNNDEANFGTTIHVIDSGVDTGAVLKQVFTKTGKQDNFTTYPILQTAIGIEALREVLPEIIAGRHTAVQHTTKGKLFYQPTIWQFLMPPKKI